METLFERYGVCLVSARSIDIFNTDGRIKNLAGMYISLNAKYFGHINNKYNSDLDINIIFAEGAVS